MRDKIEARLDDIVELMLRIADGDYDARGEISSVDDPLDGIVAGLNMLAEQLARQHRARRAAEALLKDALDAYDSTPGLFCSVNEDLKLIKCNDTFAAALGAEKTNLLGSDVRDVCADDSAREMERFVHALREGSRPGRAELCLNGRDGLLTVSFDGDFIVDGGGARVRLLGQDVTQQRETEQALLQAQRMDALGRLAGGIAHDFNNLLQVIRSATGFLGEEVADRTELVEEVDAIEGAVERAADLVKHLMVLGRRPSSSPPALALDEWLTRVTPMLQRLLRSDIELKVETGAGPYRVAIDATHLEQMVVNLAVNARHALPRGGVVTLSLQRHVVEGEPQIELCVSDDGVGMNDDVRQLAFEPFFTTRPPDEGTGLGLSTCYGIVQQAGGTITLESAPGDGTTVCIFLPEAGAPGAAERQPEAPRRAADGAGATVLVVDDDDAVRRATVRVLKQAGYVVSEADGGEAALTLLDEGLSPDLLLSDVVMPRLSGPELLAAARARVAGLPALLMTGFTRDASVQASEVPVLAKPFHTDALLEAVGRALSARPADSPEASA